MSGSESLPAAGPSPDAPSVSVVICCYTFDRWDDVCASIDSALAQWPAPLEVLVVVDHNPDLLDRLVTDVLPGRPSVGIVPNAATQGLSGARNTALLLVGGEIVAFLDDDARACEGWLAGHLAAYADARVLGVGGRLVPMWDTERPGWFPHDFDWVIGCTHSGVPAEAAPIRNPIGANMSFRTDALRTAGGFSESLGRVGTVPLGCEETEASIRVSAQHPDGLVWYTPDAVVEHRVTANRGTWTYFRRRCVAEGRSKATVRELSAEPLGTERQYATVILPRSFARAVRSRAQGDPAGLRRAGAIAAGLGLTTFGYARALAENRVSGIRARQGRS